MTATGGEPGRYCFLQEGQSVSTEGQIIRRLYRSSVVSIVIAAVAAMFGMLIDGVIIGKFLGTDCMAAYGLVTPLFSIMTAISGVLAAGSQIYCAKYLGAGRTERARQVFSACMVITVIIAAAAIVILLLFCEPLCVIMGAKKNAAHLLPYTKDYLYGIAPGILPVLLLFIFNALMRLDGDPDRVIWAVIVMTVFDIVGDLLVALVLHAGMAGMGISTALSYYAALAVLLLHFRKPDIIFRFSMKDIQWNDLKEIFTTGAPTAVGSVSTMIRNLLLNLIMVSVASSTAVAALSVRNTLNTLFGSILLGIGMTTTMIAGMVYGEEDKSSARHLMQVSLRYALGFGLALAVLAFAAADPLVMLFASGKEDSVQMAAYAVRAMRIYAFGLPLYGINMVFVNYLQGIGRLRLANLISVLDNLIFVTAIAWIFSPVLGMTAVWISYPIGEVLVLLSVFIAAFREHKQIPRTPDDMLFLPDGFGVSEEDTYERSFRTVSEVMTASEELDGFMKAHQASPKEKMLIPLCVEEMAKNVVEHGIAQGKKDSSAELRVVKKNEDWIIRVRDNCKAFDPKQWIHIHNPEDPSANIGIRMVCGMAKDVKYVNAMQLNTLIIKV